MFKALLKTRLRAFLTQFGGRGNNKKSLAGKPVLMAFLLLYIAACLIFIMGTFFMAIAEPYHAAGLDWLYFAFYGMLSFGMMFILSVFMTQSQIYDAKDNELLLSMPIPPSKILASRILALIIENFGYGLLVALPALVVWLMHAPLSAAGIIAFVLITFTLPFFVFSVSGIFGYLLHLIMMKVKNKTMISTVFSVAFLAVYFYFYSKLNTYIQTLITGGEQIAESISAAVKPVYWLGAAVADGNILYLLGVLAVICAAFFAVYMFLSATFIKMTSTKKGAEKVKYERREVKASSPAAALLKKEISRLLSSSVYLLNAGLGLLMLLVLTVYAAVKKDTILMFAELLPIPPDALGACAAVVICFVLSMVMFSVPSISLEGKSLWIPKTLPVPAETVLFSKVDLHIVLTAPVALISSVIFLFILDTSLLMSILLVLLPLVFTVFTALLGVVINLRFCRFDWKSEAEVVKQGVGIMIYMFGMMLIVIIPTVLYIALLYKFVSAEIMVLAFAAVLAAASFAMYRYIKTGGARRFMELN